MFDAGSCFPTVKTHVFEVMFYGLSTMVKEKSPSWRPPFGRQFFGCFSKHFLGQIQGESKIFKKQLSNEKRVPDCLGFIRDENLPSYVGIIS